MCFAVALTEALRNVEASASNLLHDKFPRHLARAIHDSSIDGAIYERTA
jgi:pyoverdine/dityrosine biosynthesis protein Dit1